MLWLGLLQRDTGTPASQHLQIKDEVLALDFNLAVTLRLLRFDNEVMKQQAKVTAYEVSKIFGSGEDEEATDALLDSEFIENDKFADANTEVW